jgi:hypothetical protein
LYKLKQAPRAWFEKIDNYLLELGLSKIEVNYNFYHICDDGGLLLLILYVDDLFLIGCNKAKLSWLKHQLLNKFEMYDLGSQCFYLGVEFLVLKVGLMLTQHAYILPILKEFWMDDANLTSIPFPKGLKLGHELDAKLFNVSIYCRLVRKLIYLFNSQPDLLFVVGVLSTYMHDPKEQHWRVAKHILRYLKGTIAFGIVYG